MRASGSPDVIDVSVQMVIIIIHNFYTALFSALEQTHCAHVACDSDE